MIGANSIAPNNRDPNSTYVCMCSDLQAAVQAGFDDVKKLDADPDFAALTTNPVFKQFVDDLRPKNLFDSITRMF